MNLIFTYYIIFDNDIFLLAMTMLIVNNFFSEKIYQTKKKQWMWYNLKNNYTTILLNCKKKYCTLEIMTVHIIINEYYTRLGGYRNQ